MIMDQELVLLDNVAQSAIATSDVVKMQNAYKPMFLYIRATGSGNVVGTLKVSDKADMSNPTTVGTYTLTVAGKNGVLKVSLPIVDKKEFYVRLDSTTTITSGKIFAAIVNDVQIN